ncbi:hypothetical protein [Pseudomonas helleri]|uniref:hypothetical protein n=1 Tax=Pseudomonas helleri TaxID=1608996 RepID=UPI003F94794D
MIAFFPNKKLDLARKFRVAQTVNYIWVSFFVEKVIREHIPHSDNDILVSGIDREELEISRETPREPVKSFTSTIASSDDPSSG